MITPVTSQEHIAITASLAYKIWNEHYVPIIGQAQVDYMIDKFQTVEAFSKQIEDAYLYFLISHSGNFCGYLALVPDITDQKLMISKIYVDSEYRGYGLGLKFLDFAETEARKSNLPLLWLTVNKYNYSAIAWYRKYGFEITTPVQFDIGNGFIMDDYIMEKYLV
ncbi:MAG TPA: GNAT family N-acetyltransferase [Aquaticitalea sp.]|nr:GNAT family N-acetyltransferase [Aquaticitalea sp.]